MADFIHIADFDRKSYRPRSIYLCGCGNQFVSYNYVVNSGRRKACGDTDIHRVNVKHDDSNSTEYYSWTGMKKRCLDSNNHAYYLYGGRGITIHEDWVNDYQKFLDDMGRKPTPGHSIDRIDVNGNYEPSNCRWVTMKQQQRNRRNTLFVDTPSGRKRLTVLAEDMGITYKTAYMRLYRDQLEGVNRV